MTRDINDLIKVAEGSVEGSKAKVSKGDQEIRRFVADLNIKESNTLIPKALTYDYYTQWAKSHPMTNMAFFRYFNRYFKSKRVLGVSCYLIDPIAFGLPEFYNIYKDNRFNFYRDKPLRQTRLKGVYLIAGYYIARLRTEEGLHYLGRFKQAKDAAKVYDLAAYEHFGNDADLNYPRNIRDYGKETEEKRTPIR